ncbi:unnamed protein product [Paramecium pentaurelia]|uniref:Uncharacterized protein n=1 Tax=Paramecium pentaurelia TaxID=43138 RepID=A0A8S1VUB2_9CILI|nr:unnamed protein product [Paramecium pentaurelia]
MYLENEEKNYNLELKDIHKSKQFLIEFLEQKLLGFKEQNQQLKLLKKISIKNKLGCKTNNLGEECSRLNNIIKQRDDQIYRLQVQLKDLMNINGKNQYQEDLLDLLQTKEGEINILKEQNETSQHKQLQKFAEDAKINSITMNQFMSKCEIKREKQNDQECRFWRNHYCQRKYRKRIWSIKLN